MVMVLNICAIKSNTLYHLRNADKFRIRTANTTAVQKSLFYRGLQVFNNLTDDIENKNNILYLEENM